MTQPTASESHVPNHCNVCGGEEVFVVCQLSKLAVCLDELEYILIQLLKAIQRFL